MKKQKIVSPITTKNSRFAGGADMGKSHIEIHKKERSFWHEGEPLIIVVGDEKVQPYTRKNLSELPEESIVGLVLDSAIAQGVKSPQKFQEYNQKLRKSRRYKSYGEYVLSCSKNYWGSRERKLDDTNTKSLTGKKKLSPDKLRTEKQNLAVIKSTKVAIDSSLFYLSNAQTYEKVLAKGGEELLEKYREAERVALIRFLRSPEKNLLSGAFRKEVHLDEAGAMHAQVYSTFYQAKHIKRGKVQFDQVQWAKSKVVQEALENFAKKNSLSLTYAYRALIESRKEIDEEVKKNGGDRKKLTAVDLRFWEKYQELEKSGAKVPEPTDREKANFCHDLRRTLQRQVLRTIARQTFAEYGFDYWQKSWYVTDGRELSKREYQRKLDRVKTLQRQEAKLKEREVEHTVRVTSLEKEKEEVKKRKEESRKHEEEVKKREEEVEKQKQKTEEQKQRQTSLLHQAKTWFRERGFESEEEEGLVGFFKRAFLWFQVKVEKVTKREEEVAEREKEVDSRERKVARGEKRLVRRTKETEARLEDAQNALSAVSSWQAQQLRAQAQSAQSALRNARKATYEEEEEEEDDLEL